MNKEIAHILKERLISSNYKFADVIAGMVQTVQYDTNDGDGRKVIQKMPYSTDVVLAPDCHIGLERALVPDSSKRGIAYFEDLGINFVERKSNGHQFFKSRLMLIVWMNKSRLVGDKYVDISTFAITQAIQSMKIDTIENVGNFSRFQVKANRIPLQDNNIFSRYSYDERINQYLMPPFDFFGLELEINFSVHPNCVKKIEFEEEICY